MAFVVLVTRGGDYFKRGSNLLFVEKIFSGASLLAACRGDGAVAAVATAIEKYTLKLLIPSASSDSQSVPVSAHSKLGDTGSVYRNTFTAADDASANERMHAYNDTKEVLNYQTIGD